MSRALVVVVLACVVVACGGEANPPPSSSPSSPPFTEAPRAAEAPAAPPLDPARAVAVVRGGRFGCALRANGRVACWGDNADGSLGQGHTDPVEGAREVVGLDDAISIAQAGASACAVRRGGTVVCWGGAQAGELGGAREQRTRGRLVAVPGVSGADAIWGGIYRYCARTGTRVVCWGRSHAALDPPSTFTDADASPHVVPLEDVERIQLGWLSSHAFLRDGRVLQWGTRPEPPTEHAAVRAVLALVDDEYAARLDGSVVHQVDGAPVEVPALRGARELAGSSSRVVGLTEDGRLIAISRYDDVAPTFERGEGLAAIVQGEGDVVALTVEGGVRTWRQSDSSGRQFAAVDIVLPPTGAPFPPTGVAEPTPPPPTGPLPAWCTPEVRRVTPRSTASLVALWREIAARDGDEGDDVPAHEREARQWLCRSLREGGLEGCEAGGPVLATDRFSGVVLAWPRSDGSVRSVAELGVIGHGTEEASYLTRAELLEDAVAGELAVALELSEEELDCDGEDEDEICGMAEVRRRAFVIRELDDAVVIVEVVLDVDVTRGGQSVEATMRIADGEVIVEACGGRASRPIPAAAVTTAGATAETTTPAAVGTTTPSAPIARPSGEEIEAAAARCGQGFSLLGASDLAGARREIEGALGVLERAEGDRARRALGACLYNLGRVEEAESHLDAARAAYRRSLAVRPNATVEARLDGLGP